MEQIPAPINQPAEKNSRKPLILGLAGLVLILAMVGVLAYYPFHYQPLNGEARVENQCLYLKNNADYEWKDVRLLLNTDYKYNFQQLAAHDEYAVELFEFKKDDGTKFDNQSTLIDLYVTAVTPQKQTISNIFKFNQSN